MKKMIHILLSLTMFLCLKSNVFAATKIEEGSTIVKDGQIISYDEYSMDGRVDLETETSIENNNLIDKSSQLAKNSNSGSVIINIPFQTQQNDYYCGPASARMVLGGIGYSVTQDYMASLLGTTSSEGTYAGDVVANALNAVVAGSKYQFRWQWHTYTNISTIKGHIVEALDYGNPVMVNTMESPGDVYLVGHDIGTTLYHYGVVADYFNYGNEVTYTDPGYGRYSGFVQDQRVSITNLSYACGGRGYAW